MKKNNRVLRIGLLALVLTLVTASLVSGTFAKYVTTVDGTGTVKVAQWVAEIDGKTTAYTNQITFDLFETYNGGKNDVAGNLLAPGTDGGFSFGYKTAGSQVARKVTVTVKANNADLAGVEGLVFKNSAGTAFTISTSETEIFSKTIAANAVATEADGTVDVTWGWLFSRDDALDTADGIASVSSNITLKITVEQLNTVAGGFGTGV